MKCLENLEVLRLREFTSADFRHFRKLISVELSEFGRSIGNIAPKFPGLRDITFHGIPMHSNFDVCDLFDGGIDNLKMMWLNYSSLFSLSDKTLLSGLELLSIVSCQDPEIVYIITVYIKRSPKLEILELLNLPITSSGMF